MAIDTRTPHAGKTRSELAEALMHMSFAAQRQFPKVGNEKLKTDWDAAHEQINIHLTLLELAE